MKKLKSTYVLTYAYTNKHERYLIQTTAEIQSLDSCLNVTKAGERIDVQYENLVTGKIIENDTPIVSLCVLDYDCYLEKQLTFAMQQALHHNNLTCKKIKGFVEVTIKMHNDNIRDCYCQRFAKEIQPIFPTLEDIVLEVENFSKEVQIYSDALLNTKVCK